MDKKRRFNAIWGQFDVIWGRFNAKSLGWNEVNPLES
jgi:hypothetical protein